MAAAAPGDGRRVRTSEGMPQFKQKVLIFGLAVLLAGCTGGPSPLMSLPQPGSGTTSATPSPLLSAPSLAALLPQGDSATGTPTEVYTRIARGVLTCWFGAKGPLKATHIYHAEAEPASKGGKSEIEIFQKDPAAQDPRSLRAYRITILPSGSAAKVETENIKVAEPLASRLNADVMRWSSAEGGCGDGPVTGGWSAEQLPPPPEHPVKAAKQKR